MLPDPPPEWFDIAGRVAAHYPLNEREDITGDILERLVVRTPDSLGLAVTIARTTAVDYMRRRRGRGANPVVEDPIEPVEHTLAQFMHDLDEELDVAIAIEAIRTMLYGRSLAVFDAMLDDQTDRAIARTCGVNDRRVRELRKGFQALIPPHFRPPRRPPSDAADAA